METTDAVESLDGPWDAGALSAAIAQLVSPVHILTYGPPAAGEVLVEAGVVVSTRSLPDADGDGTDVVDAVVSPALTVCRDAGPDALQALLARSSTWLCPDGAAIVSVVDDDGSPPLFRGWSADEISSAADATGFVVDRAEVSRAPVPYDGLVTWVFSLRRLSR